MDHSPYRSHLGAATAPIVRSWRKTLMWLGASACMAGVAVLSLTMASHDRRSRDIRGWAVGNVAIVLSVIGFICMFGAAGRVTCPHCGALIEGVDPSGDVEPTLACEGCHSVFTIERRAIRGVRRGEVFARACLHTDLAADVRWPEGCVVCEHAASRALTIEATTTKAVPKLIRSPLDVTHALEVLRRGNHTTLTMNAPHCDAHAAGVQLDFGPDGSARIAFRSVDRFLAFCEHNHVKPRRFG